ncbi:MAG: hypothetical protein ACRD1J_05520 [Terriglobia bacterium]
MIVALVTAILGALLGTAGFIISILAFLRDRPNIRVTLVWDLESTGHSGVRIGLVNVTNIGRRAIYIGAVALELPKTYKYNALLLWDSISGNRLGEGDPPAKVTINYDSFSQYKSDWNKIRAFAEDSAGKKYYSDYPGKKPSWAQDS